MMQGPIRMSVDLIRSTEDIHASRSQGFMVMQDASQIPEASAGIRYMGTILEESVVPVIICDESQKEIATVIPGDPTEIKKYLTLDEQLAQTCSMEDTTMGDALRASVPRISYPYMMYDKESLIRITITHMDTGDDLWTGTFVIQNPLVEQTPVKIEEDTKVKIEKTREPQSHVAEPFLYEGTPETVHLPLWCNLNRKPGNQVYLPEGQIVLQLQRVCNADSGKPLALFGGESSWAIKSFAFGTHAHRFGL